MAAEILALYVIYILGLVVLAIGSYTDIKTREVPDWINFGLIGAGFGINLLFSILYWKISFVINSIIGFAFFFAIALAMFYTGQWGGGDSKILMGLGALIGIDFFSKNFFLLHFIVNSLIIGALYGILWSIISIIRNRKKFYKNFRKKIMDKKIRKLKSVLFVISITLAVAAFLSSNFFARLLLSYFALAVIITFYMWIMMKSVEDSYMLKHVSPEQLTEGDWIANEIIIGGKYITGPKDLGIEKNKIKILIALYKKGKLKKVLIKEGIPFVPSFFIAYIITLIFGGIVGSIVSIV
ncbi:prepilin peptidase [Candidatus Woesearchaeota archaeon]|nr:prepilin peptidase [Candidatus Woesearchaeota archaeon]